MQGKKYGNTIVMYALPDDLNWEAYINSVNDVEENAFFIQYQLLVDGNLVGMTQRSNYTFVIAYNDGGNIVQEQSPFLFYNRWLSFPGTSFTGRSNCAKFCVGPFLRAFYLY